MIQSVRGSRDGPLALDECHVLADALGDTPETVIAAHVLKLGLCKAYVAGTPSGFNAAIVQATDLPTEPQGFGSDSQILWELLKRVEGWDCILVDTERAPDLGELIERERNVPVRYLNDVYHLLTEPVPTFLDKTVCLLTESDVELLGTVPHEFRVGFWGSAEALLAEGIVAGAVIDGQVVATAFAAAYSEHYAEIGVYTHPDFRSRGLATAAASLVVKHVQESGRTRPGAREKTISPRFVSRESWGSLKCQNRHLSFQK